MDVEPANIEQVRQAADGSMVLISKEASTVAADLARLDKNIKVRFAENAPHPFWAIRWEDGRDTYLIATVQAHQNHFGVWEGLDDRVVKRLEYIDPQGRGGYDYAKDFEVRRKAREKREKGERDEFNGEIAEKVAHALRKDMGEKYKGRIFKP